MAQPSNPSSGAADAKAKMKEALEKKAKTGASGRTGGPAATSKVGGQAGANAPKMFRRKSGSA